MLDPMVRLKWNRRAKMLLRDGLSKLGQVIPRETKLRLARRSSKLGYLLYRDGDFVLDGYLGSLRVKINTVFAPERIMLAGEYERDLLWTIREFIRPGDVAIDVGANVGAITLALAKAVGETGKVHSFEPGPVFCSRLRDNLALNPYLAGCVELHPIGVSNRKGVLHWAQDPEFPGNAYLFGKRGLEIEVVTLDECLGPRLDRLDFMKVDVEGMELEVLEGARSLIQKFRPKIFFETIMGFETYRNAPIRKAASELLIGLGYDLYRATESEGLVPVRYPDFADDTFALPR